MHIFGCIFGFIFPVQKSAVIRQDPEHVPLLTQFPSSFLNRLGSGSFPQVFWNWLTSGVWLTARHFFLANVSVEVLVSAFDHTENKRTGSTRDVRRPLPLWTVMTSTDMFFINPQLVPTTKEKKKNHLHKKFNLDYSTSMVFRLFKD